MKMWNHLMKMWKNNDEEDNFKRNIEFIKYTNNSLEDTIKQLLPHIKMDLPSEKKIMMINPMLLSYENSKVNVRNIDLLLEPTKSVAFSNFTFGKMFGKTELIMQILNKK